MLQLRFLGKNHIKAASQAKHSARSCHAQCWIMPEILGAEREVTLNNNKTAPGRDRVRTWFCHSGLAKLLISIQPYHWAVTNSLIILLAHSLQMFKIFLFHQFSQPFELILYSYHLQKLLATMWKFKIASVHSIWSGYWAGLLDKFLPRSHCQNIMLV